MEKIENEKRYREYALKNPEMDREEVVWRVNNNLDKEKYTADILVTDTDSLFIIVNKFYKLPFDYEPSDLVEIDGALMRKTVADAYIKMRDTAKSEGFKIKATSAYRSAQMQQEVYNRFLVDSTVEEVDKTVARPCYSEHQTGLAVDIEGSISGGRNISKTPEAAWLKENCYKFGFILRYQPEIVDITGYASEAWHFRYVGIDVSRDMKEKNIMSFEEYRERFLNTDS